MKNAIYWIALQNALGYATVKPIRILEHYSSVKDFFKAGEREWRSLKMFTPNEIAKLRAVDFKKSERVLEICRKCGYTVLTPDDEEYPVSLQRINNPPSVLYVQGRLPDLSDEVAVAMVGTRKCSRNGMILASVLSYRLAEAGAVIVSGGAMGIDTNCSNGAVAAHKESIIVLGCGHNYPYLMNNREIRDKVAENGAVVSEYQPDYPPSVYTFPVRNRIMSALSQAVAVIEAPAKSGSLITASHALEQGKDVFAVPGDITSGAYSGNNKLLQDGARPIYTPMDILGEYAAEYPHKLNLKNCSTPLGEDRLFVKLYNKQRGGNAKTYSRQEKPVRQRREAYRVAEPASEYSALKKPDKGFVLPPLTFDADEIVEKVYKCFTNKPKSMDILIQESGLDAGDVLYALTELEIGGAVTSLPGSMFEVKI